MVDIERLRAANPLRQTVERLTGQPIVRHKIKAPWREERTPSLHIYEDGRWKDYGTGEHGDVIDFVGRYYFGSAYEPSVHFQEVVDRLGGIGIAPPPQPVTQQQRPQPKTRLLFDLAQIESWHQYMPAERWDYWYSRGLQEHIIRRHLLGWDGKRYTIPHLYRNIPFGIKRRQSEIDDGIAVKYIAAKGSRAGLFNADALWKYDTITICEGEIDAMLLSGFGFPAVSGTTGAGTFKAEWVRLFAGVERIYVLYDNDEAGLQGARRVKQVLRRAQVRRLPQGINDVGDLVDKEAFPVNVLKEVLQ